MFEKLEFRVCLGFRISDLEFYNQMRVVITGANGFVGPHLAKLLKEKGADVTGFVFGSLHKKSEFFVSCEVDITNYYETEKAILTIQPDQIYHLAAQSSVHKSWEAPLLTYQVNVLGTLNLLEAAKKLNKEVKVLIVGSAEEYGMLAKEKVLTEEDPLCPQNPYALTKALVEYLVEDKYFTESNLKIIRTRSFLHIGPGQATGFVTSDFASQIANVEKGKQEPILKVGNLEAKRDFLDVRDVVRAYSLLLEKGKAGEVYQVTRGKNFSVQEILEKLLSLAAKEIKIEQDPAKIRRVDLPRLLGSNEKIKKETGWQPEIPIEQTLNDVLEYWRNNEK